MPHRHDMAYDSLPQGVEVTRLWPKVHSMTPEVVHDARTFRPSAIHRRPAGTRANEDKTSNLPVLQV